MKAALQSENKKTETLNDWEAMNTAYRQQMNKTLDQLQQEVKQLK